MPTKVHANICKVPSMSLFDPAQWSELLKVAVWKWFSVERDIFGAVNTVN